MIRRHFLGSLVGLAALPLTGCAGTTDPEPDPSDGFPDDGQRPELYKTAAEWRTLLDPVAYSVLFQYDTELPESSHLNDEYRPGTYLCAACFIPLFTSETKYNSHTGWPSFWNAIDGRLGFRLDYELSEIRTEYHSLRCGGHQGHVFDDGPLPTGKRHCNNGVSLWFIIRDTPLPALRT
jgi:peptide-methionine (R)-S-oxide reductase